jgi:hypothetical protein
MKTIQEETTETPNPASCIPQPASTPLQSPNPRMYSDEEVARLARAFAFGFGALSTEAIEQQGFEVQHLLQLGWIKKTPGRWSAGWTYAGEFTNHYCQALKSL